MSWTLCSVMPEIEEIEKGCYGMEFVTNSPEETERVGEQLAQKLRGNEVIAMRGGLGMGKTAFVRGLARGLGAPDIVSSPTFAIVNEYQGKFPVYHFDMYRVSSMADLYSTGFFDFLDTGILVIEWSENVEEALPEGYITVAISQPGGMENQRRIQMEGVEEG